MGAVHLDGARADLQVVGDHLVGLAFHEVIEHAALPGCQGGQKVLCRLRFRRTLARPRAHFHRPPHTGQHHVVIERLFDEIDGAGLHGLHRKRHIAMAGDDDDGKLDMAPDDFDLQFQPAHIGHPDIGDQAALLGIVVRQEMLCRVVAAYPKASNFQ